MSSAREPVFLWDLVTSVRSLKADVANAIGPYYTTGSSKSMLPFVRELDCPLYGACLDLAVNKNWPSFTCAPCILSITGRFSRSKEDRVVALMANIDEEYEENDE